jgi:hypothetical protein
MTQSHPRREVIRDRQDVSQSVYLKLIERFIDSRFQQRLELMHAVFDLSARLGVFAIAISILYGKCRRSVVASEAEGLGRYLQQTVFESLDGLVDDGVYCIDDVVD